MAFLDRLNEITKPKTYEAAYDFGKGDGDETLTFKALSYNDRKRIIFDRMDVIGKDKDGNDIWGVPRKHLPEMNAEILANCWIRPDGKTVATKDAFMQWDSDLLDKLSSLCSKAIGMVPDKKEDAENPSQPKS